MLWEVVKKSTTCGISDLGHRSGTKSATLSHLERLDQCCEYRPNCRRWRDTTTTPRASCGCNRQIPFELIVKSPAKKVSSAMNCKTSRSAARLITNFILDNRRSGLHPKSLAVSAAIRPPAIPNPGPPPLAMPKPTRLEQDSARLTGHLADREPPATLRSVEGGIRLRCSVSTAQPLPFGQAVSLAGGGHFWFEWLAMILDSVSEITNG